MLRRLFFLCLSIALLTPAALRAQAPRQLTVMWMKSAGDSEVLLELIETFAADFEAANPATQINIKFVDWSEGRQSILADVEAGSPPDLAVIGARWVPEFALMGLIEPLDHYLTPEFRARFIPAIINEGAVYQGQTFGLPVNTSTRALYYNRAMFQAAGLDHPPQTWDDLLAAGVALRAAGYDGFGLQGGGGLETNTYFYYFVWGNGGSLYNPDNTASAINSPAAVEALAFLKAMIDSGATQPDPHSEAYDRRASLELAFAQGELAMVISGTWLNQRLHESVPDLDFGVAPIPYHTTPATYGVIDTLVMFSTARNKDLAWQYLEYLYQPDNRMAYYQAGGFLPELIDPANDPLFRSDPHFAVFLDLLPQARFEPLHVQSEAISQIVIDTIRAVYRGEVAPQDALDAAAYAIDELLNASVAGW